NKTKTNHRTQGIFRRENLRERNPRSTAAAASPPPEAPAGGVRGLIPSFLAFIYSLCRRVTCSLCLRQC
ncbi:unnamed protein product, partial [Arabidopsis halleri]